MQPRNQSKGYVSRHALAIVILPVTVVVVVPVWIARSVSVTLGLPDSRLGWVISSRVAVLLNKRLLRDELDGSRCCWRDPLGRKARCFQATHHNSPTWYNSEPHRAPFVSLRRSETPTSGCLGVRAIV